MKFNLTRIIEKEDVAKNIFRFNICRRIYQQNAKVIDIGAGAGFLYH